MNRLWNKEFDLCKNRGRPAKGKEKTAARKTQDHPKDLILNVVYRVPIGVQSHRGHGICTTMQISCVPAFFTGSQNGHGIYITMQASIDEHEVHVLSDQH